MFGPSSIRRDPKVPLRTRVLPNGSLVVENAYEGTLYIGDVSVAEIKRLRLADEDDRRPAKPAT